MKTKQTVLALLCASLTGGFAIAQTTHFVSPTGTCTSNCTTDFSNGSAYATIEAAITAASAGDKILVKQGTYKPSGAGNENHFYSITVPLEIRGGFDGTSTSPGSANPELYPTILSGDVDNDNIHDAQNSNRIMVVDVSTNSSLIIDGFRFKFGWADGSGADEKGAALFLDNDMAGVTTVSRCKFESNHADLDGGAIYVTDGTTSMDDCDFITNDADVNGGAVYLVSGSTLTATDCFFDDNDATTAGGAMYATGATVTLEDAEFEDNTSVDGGALYAASSSVVDVETSLFERNASTDDGGALYISASNLILTQCTLTSNDCGTTGDFGGAVFVTGTATGTELVTQDCYFNLNDGHSGGAIALVSGALISSDDDIFYDNNATTAGGAIYTSGASVSMTDAVFESNSSVDGGGIFATSSSTITIASTLFDENVSTDEGGALYLHTSATDLSNVMTFTSNSATNKGGAIFATSSSSTTIEIDEAEFTSNSAANGGVIYLNDNTILQLRNSLALGNSASANGGVLYNNTGSTANIGNLNGRCNIADFGAMFYAETNTAHYKMTNILGAGNVADEGGSIYYSEYDGEEVKPTMELYHGTFFNNGTGSGTLFEGFANSSVVSGDGYVESTVFYQNATTTFANGTADYSIAYSLNDGTGGQNGFGMLTPANEYDPEFVSLDGECEAVDLRLTNASDLIDRANSSLPDDFADVDNTPGTTSLSWDLDMMPREDDGNPYGGTPDIGAYELEAAPKSKELSSLDQYGSIFPNPTSGNLSMRMNNPIKTVMIYNISGQLQAAGVNVNDTQATVDMSSLASGMYFVKISDGLQQYNYKVEKY